MDLDWAAIEQRLYALSVETLQAFAAEHPDEVFYGLAFDCDASFGEVRLCLNTEEALRAQVAANHPYSSCQEVENHLCWRLDEWRYPALNSTLPEHEASWQDAWWPVQDRLQEQILEDEEKCPDPDAASATASRFLEVLARVLVRLESDDSLRSLRRAEGFRTFLRDCREPVERSWERLEGLRESPANTVPNPLS